MKTHTNTTIKNIFYLITGTVCKECWINDVKRKLNIDYGKRVGCLKIKCNPKFEKILKLIVTLVCEEGDLWKNI
jgi:hypothetical protein